MRSSIKAPAIGAVLALLVVAGAASAQQLPPRGPEPVKLEIGGFGGASGSMELATGLSDAFAAGLRIGGLRNVETREGSSLKWVLGGNIGVGLGSNVIVVGEVLMNRIANPSFTGTAVGQPVALDTTFTLSEFTGGVHYILIPGGMAPYLGGALGIARLSFGADVEGLPSAVSTSETDVTWNVGGGVRFHRGGNWGFRPDVRIVRVPDDTYLRATLGIYFSFR